MEINDFISGKTKFIGIIGNPVEHSISPQLHNTISRELNIDLVYVPFHVEKESLGQAVKGLKALNVWGFNVTVPYKKEVMKYIDENSKEALLMGAVNTVKNIDGRLYGYNTDAEGFARSFYEETGTGFKGKNIAVLGAGGASRAMTVKMAMDGASKITIINRTLLKAQELSEVVNDHVAHVAKALPENTADSMKALRAADIIVNTTSAGMYPDTDVSPLPEDFKFEARQVVYDAIYNPLKTKMLYAAEKGGAKIVNGLGMLFYQGIAAYEIWSGIKLKEDFIKELHELFKKILKN